tara:strand:- start:320 stop:1753 length:1434 start_codon:yes stop_codon:yes gene_type:complete
VVNDDRVKFLQFLKDRNKEEWVVSCKKSVDWFLSFIEKKEWKRRKLELVKYFSKQQRSQFQDVKNSMDIEDEKARVAFYEDWIAWYLYLIESIYLRPYVDEPSQSARVYPFFAVIGRNIELAKNIGGINHKVQQLMNGKENQPDSVLFEIVVAIMYLRNGWKVKFVPESSRCKTPDLLVERAGDKLYVECKRQSKVTEYSEKERASWRKRWSNLLPLLVAHNKSIFLDVVFKEDVEKTEENILVDIFSDIFRRNLLLGKDVYLERDNLILSAKYIDMNKVKQHFDRFQVRWNSPQMISLFSGGYDSSAGYTYVCSPTEMFEGGIADDESILNLFCGGVDVAYCAKWECISEGSIDKKAKDVRKLLGKAVDQAPENIPTIIHIGYETLHGPLVEYSRANKIYTSINSFDYKNKNIKAVYCHAIQSVSKVDGFECAETTMRFGRGHTLPESILKHDLLFDDPSAIKSNDTHWNQDLTGI